MNESQNIESLTQTVMMLRQTGGDHVVEAYLSSQSEEVRNAVMEATRLSIAHPSPADVISSKVDEKWYHPNFFSSTGNWLRYRDVLEKKNMGADVVETIDRTTTQILNEMTHPAQPSFQTYGLVLGYVQSGKTANYTGVMAKAADAGYDFIIILAGLHNNLRLQTQHRIDRELTAHEHHSLPGVKVEVPPPEHSWRSLTLDDDFNVVGNARRTVSAQRPVYAVMKKNCTVLEKFLNWLAEAGEDVLTNKRLLLIDDEADHASVNTGTGANEEDYLSEDEEEYYDEEPGDLNQSRTNELIRRLLKLFDRRAYIGYTATPFANVLIDPFEEDAELGPTLYPRDFIISLPKPDAYIGAEDMFTEHTDPSRLEGQVRIIPDDEADRIRDLIEPEDLPSYYCEVEKSLRDAVLDFVLSGCCRIERGHTEFHHSMLVHVHHMTDVQSQLFEKVNKMWETMKNYLRFTTISNEIIEDLEERWKLHFHNRDEKTTEEWEDIKKHLVTFTETVEVREINSSNKEGDLDYHNHPKGLKVIAIGGNKLSRGLTLEGLTVSYFGRPTQMYDSLLQMGRWFGYRPGYKDLVRLHLTAELLEWFSWLGEVERQVRVDIERYDRLNKSPDELAVRIKTHPQMAVTSALKRRSGREIRVGWDGQTTQSLYFNYSDIQSLQENLNIGSRFIEETNKNHNHRNVQQHHIWDDVKGKQILDFINSLNYPPHATFDRKSISSYIRERNNDNELDSWSVCLINLDSKHRNVAEIGGFSIQTVTRTRQAGTKKIPDLVASEHWSIDLEDYPDAYTSETEFYPKRLMFDSRSVNRGLLLIYIIDGHTDADSEHPTRSSPFEDSDEKSHILGLGIAFPISDRAERAGYIAVEGVPTDEY